MPKPRIIRVKFEANRAAAKSVNQRVIAPGKKKISPRRS